MSEKNDEITALTAENERLRTNAVKMLDEVDREYNRKTNAMIERHAAAITRLTAEVERWKHAFAVQSRKLQSVLHIPEVRAALKEDRT
jgi:hypothetical protein